MKTATTVAAIAAALFTVGVASSAAAQSTTAPPKADAKAAAKAPMKNMLSEEDRTFMMKAGADGMAEVEMGKSAQQKAAHPQVKAFGARMVADHGKANAELKGIASRKGVSLPSAPDQEQKAHADKMQKMPGAEFDRGYMEHMVADHQKAVELFERTAQSSKDPDVKAFAAKTLPTLKEHLKMAQSTAAAVKGTGSPKDPPKKK
jgi:putative membrane protein